MFCLIEAGERVLTHVTPGTLRLSCCSESRARGRRMRLLSQRTMGTIRVGRLNSLFNRFDRVGGGFVFQLSKETGVIRCFLLDQEERCQ